MKTSDELLEDLINPEAKWFVDIILAPKK